MNVHLTLDIDWTPDWIVQQVAEILVEKRVKATWFITHDGPALEYLRKNADLFELGIHPNFQSGSTHGSTPESVLEHVLDLVPEARSMRTHGLLASTPILTLAASSYGIRYDSSVYLPGQSHLKPCNIHYKNGALFRLPIYWEDDCEMVTPQPDFSPRMLEDETPGLKILDFHPIHVALNSNSMARYEELKRSGPPETWTEKKIHKHRNTGNGAGTLFQSCAETLGTNAKTIHELTESIRESS